MDAQRRKALVGAGIGIVILAILVRALDLGAVRDAVVQARFSILWWALLAVALDYLVIGVRFAFFGEHFRLPLSHRELFRLGVVSIAVNRAAGLGGLAGYSLRVHVVAREGGTASPVLATSIVNNTFKISLLGTVLPLVLGLLLWTGGAPAQEALLAALTVSVASVVGWRILVVVALAGGVREAPRRFNRLARWMTRARESTGLDDFRYVLGNGLDRLGKRPLFLAAVLALAVVEVLAEMLVLYVCLVALQTDPSVLALVFAYAVALFSRLITLVPGGLGLQEASMAAALALFAVPLEAAVLAVLLYRALLEWGPVLLALVPARRLLRGRSLLEPPPVGRDGIRSS